MSLVALGSIKGSPGVTTTALALAAAWSRERSAVVAELDPAGADVAAWHVLAPEPSVVTLAAAARRGEGDSSAALLDHCHELPGGLRVLAGSPSRTEMRTAIAVLGAALPRLAADAGLDLVADCGRLDHTGVGSAPLATRTEPGAIQHLVRRADAFVLVARGQLADLSHLDAWLPDLRALNDRVGLLLVGPLRWRAEEIALHFDVEIVGHLPLDATGADLVGGRPTRGGVRRLPLLRAARQAAERIAVEFPKLTTAASDQQSGVAAELRGIVAAGEAVT